ncbi:MAG: hypothetical protein K6U87_11180, partial [Firmicutes bacterium]|nr:hypothetical protein [Bacillota bacterium]
MASFAVWGWALAWAAVAGYQAWTDWRTHRLPYGASAVAAAIGLAHWAWLAGPAAGEAVLRHLAAGLLLGAAWLPAWWWWGLGDGDVVALAAIGCGLGFGGGLAAATAGWAVTAAAVAGRRMMRRPAPAEVPLGPGLWLAAA